MAPKTDELRENPGQFLGEHIAAFNEISVLLSNYLHKVGKGKTKGADLFDADFLDADFSDGDLLIEEDEMFDLFRGFKGGGYSSYQLKHLAPANALTKAKANVESAKKNNANALIDYTKATDLKEDLKRDPWSDTSGFGLKAFIQRQLLSSINLTPFNGLNRFEVSDKGLTIFQPFRAVSTRTVTYQDLVNRNVVLSINPPAYFDLMLGLLGQFRWGRNIPSPWGQLVVDEPGSGRIVGTTVVLWPAEKQKKIESLLKELESADGSYYERIVEVPDVASQLLGYDVKDWRQKLEAWIAEPSEIPDHYLKILYIEPPEEKKEKKKTESAWPKRLGCISAIILFLGFVLIWPIWWIVAFVWRRLSLFLPKPLRFFVK